MTAELPITILTDDERAELIDQERVIERNLQTFIEVGNALLVIRDKRLYRDDYDTFETYCQERWQITVRHAQRLMGAAQVVGNLGDPWVASSPQTERQTRPLTTLATPDEQRLAWQIVENTAPTNGNGDKKITSAHVQSVVNVLKEIKTTGALDPGTGEMLPISEAVKAAITEDHYERIKRQEMYIAEKVNGRQKPKVNRAGDEYVPQGFDACQTPGYALDPLLPYVPRDWVIWEPASGEGLLVEALYDNGFDEKSVLISDLLHGQNFFDYQPVIGWDCLITNPPYSIKYRWIERCYALGKPFALLLPVETLGAKTAQAFFREYGLEIILMDQRINFKMPLIGFEGSAAQFPTAWFTWGLNIGHEITFAEIKRND